MIKLDTASQPDGRYHSLTIYQAIEKIKSGQISLPLLQRDLVWNAQKAAQLFDSVMQSFPINSMLFWEMASENLQIPMYNFIQHYTNYNDQEPPLLGALHDNKPADINQLQIHAQEGALLAVLDGQQRLASFYMGLTGTYAWRVSGWHSKPNNFPPRQLFLRLLEGTDEPDTDSLEEQSYYHLAWRKINPEEAAISAEAPRLFTWDNRKRELWLRVGAVIDFITPTLLEENTITAEAWASHILMALGADKTLFQDQSVAFENIITQNTFQENALKALTRLYQAIHEERHICYHLLDKHKDLATALATFIRINSGGMTLSAANLLFSALSTQWTENNIRDILKNLEQKLQQQSPTLNQTFILKAALAMVSGKNLPVSLNNFKQEFIQQMKKDWLLIECSLLQVVSIVFQPETSSIDDPMPGRRINFLQNSSLLIALAFYYYQAEKVGYVPTATDIARMRRWLIRAKLMWWAKQAAAETKLSHLMRTIRQNIPNTEQITHFPFPYHALLDAGLVEGGPNLHVKLLDSDSSAAAISIASLLHTQKYQLTTRFLLGLVQSNVHDRETYEIDHCFPYRESRDTEDSKWQEYAEKLPNLQLLEAGLNSSKLAKPFWVWYDSLPELFSHQAETIVVKLGVSNREELAIAHCWPEILSSKKDENCSNDPRTAFFKFHISRYDLLYNRLVSIIADPV